MRGLLPVYMETLRIIEQVGTIPGTGIPILKQSLFKIINNRSFTIGTGYMDQSGRMPIGPEILKSIF